MTKKLTKNQSIVALILALLLTSAMLLFVHSIAKLPSEAFWTNPAEIYANWEFAIIVGIGLPYPEITAPILLLFLLWINYILFRFFIRLFSRLFRRV